MTTHNILTGGSDNPRAKMFDAILKGEVKPTLALPEGPHKVLFKGIKPVEEKQMFIISFTDTDGNNYEPIFLGLSKNPEKLESSAQFLVNDLQELARQLQIDSHYKLDELNQKEGAVITVYASIGNDGKMHHSISPRGPVVTEQSEQNPVDVTDF